MEESKDWPESGLSFESSLSTLSAAAEGLCAGMSGESALALSMLSSAGNVPAVGVALSTESTEAALTLLSLLKSAVGTADEPLTAVADGESSDWSESESLLEPVSAWEGAVVGAVVAAEFGESTDAADEDALAPVAAEPVFDAVDGLSSGESNVESKATPTSGAENIGTVDPLLAGAS